MTDDHEHHDHEHHDHEHHDHEHHDHEHHDHEHHYEPVEDADAVEAVRPDKDPYVRHGDGSPLPVDERETFEGLPYFPVDESLRFDGLELAPYAGIEPQRFQIPTSDGRLRPAHRAGSFQFELDGEPRSLAAYVLDDPHSEHLTDAADESAGGGGGDELPSVFVPFLDATSGAET